MAEIAAMDGAMRRRLFLRSLLLQSCWNFERMQNIGFAYCVEPWLALCHGDDREARERHLEAFNTNPFVANLILGMVCALEGDVARADAAARPALIERLRALKAMTASALAGIGDAFFWATLRPAAAAFALALAALFWRPLGSAAGWIAMAVFLAAFNAPALALRWRGLGLGFLWKDSIALKLRDVPCQAVIRRVRRAGFAAALAGGAALLLLPGLAGLSGAAAFAATLAIKSKPVTTYRIYAAACLLGGIASAVGWA